MKPRPKKPKIIIAHVEGSGTAATAPIAPVLPPGRPAVVMSAANGTAIEVQGPEQFAVPFGPEFDVVVPKVISPDVSVTMNFNSFPAPPPPCELSVDCIAQVKFPNPSWP